MTPQRQMHISQWVATASTVPGGEPAALASDWTTGNWLPTTPKVAALILRNRLREKCSVETSCQ